MDNVRFGIAFQTDKTPERYEELAQLVDRYDFDVVSAYNDLFYQPAIGPLLIMAPHVRRAQIGPAVTNPHFVHPIELAGQIAVLDWVTRGRAYLGRPDIEPVRREVAELRDRFAIADRRRVRILPIAAPTADQQLDLTDAGFGGLLTLPEKAWSA